jgi:hypothetical protein
MAIHGYAAQVNTVNRSLNSTIYIYQLNTQIVSQVEKNWNLEEPNTEINFTGQ